MSAIDAITGTPANDDFTFIGLSKWHHVAGELRYVWTATQTIVEADVNGDAKVDFSVALNPPRIHRKRLCRGFGNLGSRSGHAARDYSHHK